jgi:hypothetical protein
MSATDTPINERLDVDDATKALVRHGEYHHSWECFDFLITYADLKAAHDSAHSGGLEWIDGTPDHPVTDLSAPIGWQHIDRGDSGEWLMRDGRSFTGTVTDRTATSLTIDGTVYDTYALVNFRAASRGGHR